MEINLDFPDNLSFREIFSKVNSSNEQYLFYAILPLPELIIRSPVIVLLFIPHDFMANGGVRIYCSYPEIFIPRNTSISDVPTVKNNEIIIPWLASCRDKLDVWLYTLQNFLIVPERKAWEPHTCFAIKFPLAPTNNSRDNKLICGVGRTKGKRPYMEDVDFQFDNISVSDRVNISAYGVLDGHGGIDCAEYFVEELPVKLSKYMRSGKNMNQSVFDAFVETDNEFKRIAARSRSGTTASVVVYDRLTSTGCVGATGDTRVVLSRSKRAVEMSRDKKATDSFEMARVFRAGGHVTKGRLMGTLAISRALGDLHLKTSNKPILIADPEIVPFSWVDSKCSLIGYDVESGSTDEFIVLATDGLWDVMSSQTVIDMVHTHLQSAGIVKGCMGPSGKFHGCESEIVQQLNTICTTMCVNADRTLGSADNITMMILLYSNYLSGVDSSMRSASFALVDCEDYFRKYRFNDIESCMSLVEKRVNSSDAVLHPGYRVAIQSERVLFESSKNAYTPASSVGFNSSSANAYTAAKPVLSSAAAVKKPKDDIDMDFLLDDSNF